jgi:hypothetical protein
VLGVDVYFLVANYIVFGDFLCKNFYAKTLQKKKKKKKGRNLIKDIELSVIFI